MDLCTVYQVLENKSALSMDGDRLLWILLESREEYRFARFYVRQECFIDLIRNISADKLNLSYEHR